MNEDQGDKIISIMSEMRDIMAGKEEERIKDLTQKLNRIKKKLSDEFFTNGLNESHKRFLEDVLADRVTFRRRVE